LSHLLTLSNKSLRNVFMDENTNPMTVYRPEALYQPRPHASTGVKIETWRGFGVAEKLV